MTKNEVFLVKWIAALTTEIRRLWRSNLAGKTDASKGILSRQSKLPSGRLRWQVTVWRTIFVV
jgi:hypothetical protein